MNKFDFKRAETLAAALFVVAQKRGTCLDATHGRAWTGLGHSK
jgi:hypothetical protein